MVYRFEGGKLMRARNMRRLGAALAAITVAIAAVGAALASPSGNEAARPISLRIGDAVGFTGALAAFGPSYAKSAGLAVVAANRALKRAGAANVSLSIEHADDGSSPTSAVNAARKLISGGADCIVGSLGSANTQAITLSAAVPAGVPVIAPSPNAASLSFLPDDNLLFRIAPSAVVEAPVLAYAIAKEFGRNKRLSIVSRNDISGQTFSQQFASAWKRLGGTVQGPLLVDVGAQSYDSEAQRVVAGDADAVAVVTMFPADYGKLGTALVRTGKFDTRRLFLGGGWPSPIPDYIPSPAMDGGRGARPGQPLTTSAAQAFDKLFQSTSGTKERQTLDQNNFDATMLCILAAVAANSSDGKKIASQIRRVSGPPGKKYTYLELDRAIRDLRAGRDIDYEGVSGSIDLDQRGDSTAGTYDWYQFVNREIKVLRQYEWSRGKITVRKLK